MFFKDPTTKTTEQQQIRKIYYIKHENIKVYGTLTFYPLELFECFRVETV